MSEWVDGWVSEWVDGSVIEWMVALGQVLTLPWWGQSSEVVPVPSYLWWDKCWLYPGGGRAQNWSCTSILALGQVLTLPWWWQSSEVVLYLLTCFGTSADSTLVVAELRSSPCTSLLALGQVLTLPWWWQSSEMVPVPPYLCQDKCLLYPGGGRAHKWSLYLPTCAGTSADSTLVVAELRSGPCTFLLPLGQVLTLLLWWQSS